MKCPKWEKTIYKERYAVIIFVLYLFIIIAKNEQKLPKINLDKLLSNGVKLTISQDCMRLHKGDWARSIPLASTSAVSAQPLSRLTFVRRFFHTHLRTTNGRPYNSNHCFLAERRGRRSLHIFYVACTIQTVKPTFS